MWLGGYAAIYPLVSSSFGPVLETRESVLGDMTIETNRKDEVGSEGMERLFDVFDGRDENRVANL
jgi:hypothetical protein